MARRLLDTKATQPAECFTIDEFCRAHRVGRSTYYRMRDEGSGPEEFHPSGNSGKKLITKESAARWRAARDAEAKRKKEDS
jgi:hypothetical protein